MAWSVRVILKGDEPDEAEVERTELEIANILDEHGFEYTDVSAS